MAAILQNIGLRYYVVPKGRPLPIQPDIPHIPGVGGNITEVGLNYSYRDIDINYVLRPQDNVGIQQETAELYCVGWVSYQDGAGLLRIIWFLPGFETPPNARCADCRELPLPPIP